MSWRVLSRIMSTFAFLPNLTTRREFATAFLNVQAESADLHRRLSNLAVLTDTILNNDADDPSVLLDQLLLHFVDNLAVDGGTALLIQEDAARIVAVRGTDFPSTLMGTSLSVQTIRSILLQYGHATAPLAVEDLSADLYRSLRTLPMNQPCRSLLMIPLCSGGELLGLLTLATTRLPRHFSEMDLRFTATLSPIIGAAILRRRYTQAARHADQQARILDAVLTIACTAAQPGELGTQALTLLTESLQMTGGVLFLLDVEQARLRMAALVGGTPDHAAMFESVSLTEPLLMNEAVRTGRSSFSGSDVTLPRGTQDVLDQIQMRGYAIIPLLTNEHVIGILVLLHQHERTFYAAEKELLMTIGSIIALALDRMRLNTLAERLSVETLEAFAGAIEARDGYTGEHCTRMAERAVALALALRLTSEEINTIRLAAALHDVGKIGIPDAVLNKPGRLTDDEFAIMKRHPEIGEHIVSAVEQLRPAAPLVRHHHERYDGAGYPDGLVGEDIPIGARVLAIVDAYAAMTEDRVYRQAPGHDYALSEIERGAGGHFDPHIARIFLNLLAEQTGSSLIDERRHDSTSPPRVIPIHTWITRTRIEPGRDMGCLVERDILLAPQTITEDVLALLESEPQRAAVAIGEDGLPYGLITRQHMLTKLSGLYGNALFRKRPIALLLNGGPALMVETTTPPEEAARRATLRDAEDRYYPLIVVESGRFVGLVAVSQLLDHINDEALRRARLSNPLSGLPGAPLLEAEVMHRLATNAPLSLIVADIDGFKAYNDHYGLARADDVLLMTARLIHDIVINVGGDQLVGHIGGDDFVIVSTPDVAPDVCTQITSRFAAAIPTYYDPADLHVHGIFAQDRDGQRRFFDLLSISTVFVDRHDVPMPSYLALTEEATHRKIAAKRARTESQSMFNHVATWTVA